MNKKEFDNIIREGIDAKKLREAPYQFYYTDAEFDSFVNEMEKKHYDKYDNGRGSELKPGEKTPPKMASIASSSRFCYLALRDGAEALGGGKEVEFEKSCRIKGIKGGTPPQLDAYVEDGNIFVEAKCHEIFDKHSLVMNKQYWKLLFGDNNSFGFKKENDITKETFEIPIGKFKIEGNIKMFDFKQFLCHLLGIKSYMEKNNLKKATLVYLFFKPKSESKSKEIQTVFEELDKEVRAVFKSSYIEKFCKNNNIELKAVAEYSPVMCSLVYENCKNLA